MNYIHAPRKFTFYFRVSNDNSLCFVVLQIFMSEIESLNKSDRTWTYRFVESFEFLKYFDCSVAKFHNFLSNDFFIFVLEKYYRKYL